MILVTGGAGYIGSHTVHQLLKTGEDVVVLDNLSTGYKWAVPKGAKLVVGDMGDVELVKKLIKEHGVKSVIHFAAMIYVDESVEKPLAYYGNNSVAAMNFIRTCGEGGVEHFIFSSTCATYGSPKNNPVNENEIQLPESPYGRSKLFTEWILKDARIAKLWPMRHMILRYFNVAGALPEANLGQATVGAKQLVKVSAEAALGLRPSLKVFGNDYPTKDGTGVRDYIHVVDLADAHVLALQHLKKGGDSEEVNCGYGTGASVLEIIQVMKEVTGKDFKVDFAPRRAGDVISIFADTTKIKKLFDWRPKYADLRKICASTFEYEKLLPKLRQLNT
jgi:UDP-glucose 4-epimerase